MARHTRISGVMLAAALCLGAAAAAGEAGAKRRALRIALVDVDKVLREYKRGNDRYDQIKKKFEPMATRIKQKIKYVAEERRLLAANPRRESIAYLKQKQKLQLMIAELQRAEKEYVTKRTQEEVAAMMEVWNDLVAAVAKYAKDSGLDLVLKQQVRSSTPKTKSTFYRNVAARTVLYAAARLDITEAIVKQLNIDYERGKGAVKG